MKNQTFMLVFFAIVACLQGCNVQNSPDPTQSPLQTFSSPVGTLVPETFLTLPLPTSGKAVIGGQIIDIQTQQVPLEGLVYLGNVTMLDNGNPIVELDPKTNIFAVPSSNGQFIFEAVEPGQYGLVLYTPEASFLLNSPQDGKSLIFVVEANQVLDLGRISVTMP